jgi:hypothetical protein
MPTQLHRDLVQYHELLGIGRAWRSGSPLGFLTYFHAAILEASWIYNDTLTVLLRLEDCTQRRVPRKFLLQRTLFVSKMPRPMTGNLMPNIEGPYGGHYGP